MLVAFAIAIGLHEIIAGLVPLWSPQAGTEREVVTHVEITRIASRPTATPSPPPPSSPPPRVVSHARTIASTETHVIARTTTGISARREIIHRVGAARPKPPVISHAKPIWDLPVGAQGAGAGNASGAGSVGTGGSGTGAGTSGTGSGAAAATEPCGFVEFSDPNGSRYDSHTGGFWVDIRLTVHFPDGHSDSIILDYPWYYPNEAANPWARQNLDNPNFPTTFQPPPADKRAGEPPLVQYVITHTDPGGFTLLKDCP